MAKPKQEPDDKAQSERFIEKARELEADETGEAFDRALGKVLDSAKKPREGSAGSSNVKRNRQ